MFVRAGGKRAVPSRTGQLTSCRSVALAVFFKPYRSRTGSVPSRTGAAPGGGWHGPEQGKRPVSRILPDPQAGVKLG
jgi:hypothetical protein